MRFQDGSGFRAEVAVAEVESSFGFRGFGLSWGIWEFPNIGDPNIVP